jgi:hypothetical protein
VGFSFDGKKSIFFIQSSPAFFATQALNSKLGFISAYPDNNEFIQKFIY